MQLQEVEVNSFQGQTFSVSAVSVDSLQQDGLQSNSIETTPGVTASESTASLSLPSTLISDLNVLANDVRVSYAVFPSDTLFQRRRSNSDGDRMFSSDFSTGSVIISADIRGFKVDTLSNPVQLRFEKTLVRMRTTVL